jgi:phage nucleotide-binding protein
MIDLGKLTMTDRYIRMVCYALAGTGKTDMVRYFPKPIKVYDLDDKYDPLIGQENIFIEQYLMNTNEDAKALIPKLWRDVQKDKKNKEEYETYVFDSITALNRAVERWAVIMSGKGKGAGDRATLQEFGDIKRWYNTFFPSLLSMPGNVVLLAHEQTKSDSKGNITSIRPLITGSMGDELSSIFPHTFHMEYIPGTDERWRMYYRKHAKYIGASSVLSEGKGYFEYGRDEDVYLLLGKLFEEQKERVTNKKVK